MKKLMKYLIAFIAAAVFFDGGDRVELSPVSVYGGITHIESIASTGSFDAPDTDFCISHQTSLSSVPRTQSSTRRTNTSFRHNFEFIKSGKTTHAGIRYLINLNSLPIDSFFSSSCHRLARLGRLII